MLKVVQINYIHVTGISDHISVKYFVIQLTISVY